MQSTSDFSSRKVTSRREENEERRERPPINGIGNTTPSQYMNLSKESYYQEFERPRGSIYTQSLGDYNKATQIDVEAE